jgi:hypothetical protein
MACPCPNCGRPKDCEDELCVMCELKAEVKAKIHAIGGKLSHKGHLLPKPIQRED